MKDHIVPYPQAFRTLCGIAVKYSDIYARTRDDVTDRYLTNPNTCKYCVREYQKLSNARGIA